MLTGRQLSADEGLALGIVNTVAADDSFDAEVDAIVSRIAAGPTKAFGMFKALMDTALPLAAQMEVERDHFMAATRTADFQDAARAFVEKRPPTYRGS